MLKKDIKLKIQEEINMISFVANYIEGNSTGHCSSYWSTITEISLSSFYSFLLAYLLINTFLFFGLNIPTNVVFLSGLMSILSTFFVIVFHVVFYYIFVSNFYLYSSEGGKIRDSKISYFRFLQKVRKFSKELCIVTESLEGEAYSIEEILKKDNISLFDDLSKMIMEDINNGK